ncbi:transposase [Streptomyces sp. NBC_00829]|uniref:transposase n=1 Tax=Streptomyces sp. NBC_00829 TaxID=2903679 RepID=UPI003863E90C
MGVACSARTWAATGRSRVEDGQVINGMVCKIRTGICWRDLSERYGPWKTVYPRFRRYALDGVFQRGPTSGDNGTTAVAVVGGHRHSSGRATVDATSLSAASTVSRVSAESPPETTRPPLRTKWRSVSRRSCSGQDPFEDGP